MKMTSLLIAATMAISSPMLAQTAPTPAQMAERLVQRYAMVLGLSSTQQEEAVTIYTAEETSEQTLRASEKTTRDELVAAIKTNTTATITSLSATLGELNGQSTLARSLADAKFYALLTSDQQTKFAQALASGPGGPGGPGHGPGGGR